MDPEQNENEPTPDDRDSVLADLEAAAEASLGEGGGVDATTLGVDTPLEDSVDEPVAEPEVEPAFVLDIDDAQTDTQPDVQPEPVVDVPSAFDMGRLWETHYGAQMTEAQAKDVIRLVDDFASADPQRQQAIYYLLNGGELPGAQQQPAPVPQPAQVQPESYGWGDEEPSPHVQQLEARLAQFEAQQQAQIAEQQAQQQRWMVNEQAAAAGEFAENAPIPLTREDVAALELAASRTPIFAGEYQRTGDPRAAWRAALEQTFYASPQFRDRMIAAQVEAQIAQAEQDRTRQQLASSVSAGGGTAAAAPSAAAPPQGREATVNAMAAELDRLASGQ